MNGLSTREKFGVYALIAVLAFVVLYMAAYKPLKQKHDELVIERDTLAAQKEYYDALINQNAASQEEITNINSNITDLELSFLPTLNTECLEQFVMETFEDEGCPYLTSISAQDVSAIKVLLPDGTTSNDSVIIKRIAVQYVSTDGFNIAQYNQDPTVLVEGNQIDEEAFQALVDQIPEGIQPIVGYEEFLSALQTLSETDPNTIKVQSFNVTSEAGYLIMNATIDFYALDLNSRVSEIIRNVPYVEWSGDTPATGAGFIGFPLRPVTDTNSAWCHILMTDAEALAGSRSFATYYSNAIFQQLIANNGLAALVSEEGVISTPDQVSDEVATSDDETPAA